ncbi:MAG: copper-binding protein [Phycisphaeraceae bacterium]|nr:copper-binding protein [Phycisphaeraceae bacterium]
MTDLPDPSRPASNFTIHHERIDDFVNGVGEVVGMAEMQMPFPLAEGVSIEGLGIGDKVSFTFEVRWDRSRTPPLPSWQLTEWTRLPPDTKLHFDGSN